jgi:uncharacterized protein involved in cysteine biosynthesis
MLTAASRALSQLFDPALLGVLAISVLAALAVLVGSWVGVAALLAEVRTVDIGWLDWVIRVTLGFGAFLITLALFGSIAAMIATLFIERVARAVERRFYPGLPPARRQSGREQVAIGLSFLVATIVLNILALPLYALWGANVPIFLGVNGYLLGREYFEMVALRRLDPPAVARLRKANALRLFIAGIALAALSSTLLGGLVAPILATAFMLHLFYQSVAREAGDWSRVRVADAGGSVIRP